MDPVNFGHYVNNLWSAFTLMDSKEDIKLLFKDIFTHTEYKMFAKRLEIARRLLKGESYENIMNELNVTSNTITKINNILANQGYGLRKADNKLSKLDNVYHKERQKRMAVLQGKAWPKYSGSDGLPLLVQAGAEIAGKVIKQTIKRRSATKNLPAD